MRLKIIIIIIIARGRLRPAAAGFVPTPSFKQTQNTRWFTWSWRIWACVAGEADGGSTGRDGNEALTAFPFEKGGGKFKFVFGGRDFREEDIWVSVPWRLRATKFSTSLSLR